MTTYEVIAVIFGALTILGMFLGIIVNLIIELIKAKK